MKSEGYATLNVNEWLKYYNVRSNAIELVAGTAYFIKIKPIQHEASPRIRGLTIKRRGCRFKDEQVQQKFSNRIM